MVNGTDDDLLVEIEAKGLVVGIKTAALKLRTTGGGKKVWRGRAEMDFVVGVLRDGDGRRNQRGRGSIWGPSKGLVKISLTGGLGS